MKHPCGCINEIDGESGVMYCVEKCAYHATWAITHPNDCMEHYAEMGCLVNGIPQNKKLMEEFWLGFSSLVSDFDGNRKTILEIGCGTGMYVPFFLRQGWNYIGVEPAKFAAYWTENTFDVKVYNKDFWNWYDHEDQSYDAILGAHVFEHIKWDIFAVMGAVHFKLKPSGKLFVLVPDDSDPVNPDHWWFFTPDTLKALLEKTGFVNVRMNVKQVVEREKFIYCVAEKP